MSKLLRDSEKYRNEINGRRLYTPDNPYDIETSQLVATVNRLASVVTPFKAYDLSNTVFYRAFDPQTPLSAIGLKMLGKQFANTVASQAASEYLPTISINNIFDGDPSTKFITRKIDWQVTRRESQTSFGKFIENVTGRFDNKYPFTNSPTNEDFIKNTGKGQLQVFYGLINQNYYKPSSRPFLAVTQAEGFGLNDISFLLSDKTYITDQYEGLFDKADVANARMKTGELSVRGVIGDEYADEYGTSSIFKKHLGKTSNKRFIERDDVTYNYNGHLEDNNENEIIWGRDGKLPNSNDEKFGIDNVDPNPDSLSSAFKADKGLLKYTAELLNASESKLIDQTKKKYYNPRDENEFVGYQGAGLYTPPAGSLFEGQEGIRQHTVNDPYGKFAKAIRFNGNRVYGGNENSTIYNQVIPKFHPVKEDSGNYNVKNMMFSIENLAVKTYKDTKRGIGVLDDDYGTELPIYEVGNLGGRIMWFPPYDVRLTEQSVVRHNDTVFLGRGEPLYTYMHTERMANLSFKLIVDYPPQVRGRSGKEAAEFFAYGGNGINNNESVGNVGQLVLDKKELQQQIQDLDSEVLLVTPNITTTKFEYYFPNDLPLPDEIQSAITLIQVTGYEDGVEGTNNHGIDYGLNKGFIDALSGHVKTLYDNNELEYIKIDSIGYSTKLYNGNDIPENEYNEALGKRRALAGVELVKYYIKQITNQSAENFGIKFNTVSKGSVEASTSTSTVENINTRESTESRRVEIVFSYNGNIPKKNKNLLAEENRIKNDLQEKLTKINDKINQSKRSGERGINTTFSRYTIDDGIVKNFEGFKGDLKFQPIFHSQTPEDFHRRLTFLQQCTRQGKAIRKSTNNDNGVSLSSNNSVFGRQPVQILRIGDIFHTKIIINNITIDYTDAPWDLNPEGMGMQFMMAEVTIQMKVIGGQSLKAPIDALQNALSFNYYGNSTFYDTGVYGTARKIEGMQVTANESITNKIDDEKKVEEILKRNAQNRNED